MPWPSLSRMPILPSAQFVQIDLRRAKIDAARCRFFTLAQDLGGVEQRFGRNAADVQTDAAEARVLLDESDLLALVRGVKRRGVAARTGAEDHNFSRDRFHSASIYFSLMSASAKASRPAMIL